MARLEHLPYEVPELNGSAVTNGAPPATGAPPPADPTPTGAATPTGAPTPVTPGRREHHKFLQDNALATSSAVVAGVLGFAVWSIVGHALHPGAYGKAAAVVGFYTLMTPGSALGRLVAWQTSHDRTSPSGDMERSGVLLRALTIRLFLIGVAVVVVSSILGPFASSFMHVPISYIVVASMAVPFVLATQPLMGSLQGEQRFVPWSVLGVVVALSRVVCVVALVFGLGAFGVISGATIGAAISFVICLIVVWPEITAFKGRYAWRPVVPFIVIGLAATLAIGVFVSIDVIIVEHLYPKVQSGQYAAVAVIGNAVFFATGGVASVVFPMVAARQARGRSTIGVMAAALGLCLGAGLLGSFVLDLFSRKIMLEFAGRAYVGGAYLLGWYAVGMGVLGCVVVLVNTQQSLNRLSVLWVLVPVTLLRPLLLVLFHDTLLTVVAVSDLTVTAFALAMLVVYIYNERSRMRTADSLRALRPG